ncbi:hypothetical protein ACTXT7_016220 [Hymenolepis weldensis]
MRKLQINSMSYLGRVTAPTTSDLYVKWRTANRVGKQLNKADQSMSPKRYKGEGEGNRQEYEKTRYRNPFFNLSSAVSNSSHPDSHKLQLMLHKSTDRSDTTTRPLEIGKYRRMPSSTIRRM